MSDLAIQLVDLGKMYRLHARQVDKVLHALSLNRLLFWRKSEWHEFWALRELNLTVKKGERLGIIGRNGAGKSTLLKVIAGTIPATEGTVEVTGRVQALMELGTGFHPEFTGRQNIRASLAYGGLNDARIRAKEGEIIDFAELGEFIDQPVKTYSAGMYARLAFSTATAIEPEILIIDEVLGAGDAYFTGKCIDRMKRLTEDRGATVLFVSHDPASVLRVCNRCIWLDRGKLVMDGATMEVTKAYSRHVRIQEEQRLRARNLRLGQGGQGELERLSNAMLVRFSGDAAACDSFILQRATLLRNGEAIADLALGEPQDSDPAHLSWVVLNSSGDWGKPVRVPAGGWGRSLKMSKDKTALQGVISFVVLGYDPAAKYSLRIGYAYGAGQAPVKVEAYNYDRQEYLPLLELAPGAAGVCQATAELPELAIEQEKDAAGKEIVTFPGSKELLIRRVRVVDERGQEKAILRVGERMILKLGFSAAHAGKFPLTYCAVLYRMDGVRCSCHLSAPTELELQADEAREVSLDFGPINLGNGHYVFAVALYRSIDPELRSDPEIYDLHERNYEFQVIGQSATDAAIFHHPAVWEGV
jgi:lipopolysaccharide transport system ATP-binding protein